MAPQPGWVRGSVRAVALALAVTACGSDAEVEDAATRSPEVAAEPSPEVAAEPSPEVARPSPDRSDAIPEVSSEPLAVDARRLVYANLEIAVQRVTVSNATPGTFLDDGPEPGGARYAYVELALAPELPDPGDELRPDLFALELRDGTSVDGEPVDFVSRTFVEPGTETTMHVAFEIDAVDPAAAVERATLVVGEDGRVPARLPLSGPPPQDPYPVTVPVEGSGRVELEGGCGNAVGTVEVLGAETDVDAGADHDGEALEPNRSKRAPLGERWLRVVTRVVAERGTCGGTIASDAAFRLMVDGLPTPPLNRDAALLDDGAGTEFVWGWLVPLDAPLVLEIGLAGTEPVRVPVELPDGVA